MKGIVPIIITILIVIFILYLSYLFSKYMAAGAVRLSRSKHMKIIDKMIMGQDRLLVIVQVGSRFLLLGVSGSNIQIISELKEEEMILSGDAEGQVQNVTINFKEILSKLTTKKKDE